MSNLTRGRDNPVEVLNEHLSLLIELYVQTKVIRVRGKVHAWFDDQFRHAFGLKQEAHLRWSRDCSRVNWEEFVRCQGRANQTDSEAIGQFCDRSSNVLVNVQSPLSSFFWVVPGLLETANVTTIPKNLTSSVANYRSISVTSLLSKVFQSLVSVHLGRFMECRGVLKATQFAYRKGLGSFDALLCMSRTLQSALESGQEARIVQINFCAAFDRVNHLGILYKLFSMGIGGSVLSILTQFLY